MTDATVQVQRRNSFARLLLVLAAAVVVLVGVRLCAPILNPILFAVVFALLFSPVYAWMRRRGLPTPLALLIMLVGLSVIVVGLFGFLSVSIGRFTGRLDFYATQLKGLTNEL